MAIQRTNYCFNPIHPVFDKMDWCKTLIQHIGVNEAL